MTLQSVPPAAARPVPAAAPVHVRVDGADVVLDATAATSLLRALRSAGHTAPKGACEQGECGSCSVLLDGEVVDACLVPAAICEGSEVRTARSELTPELADALARHGAVQCGFCTPGVVVSAAHLLRTRPGLLTAATVRDQLAGNLCRCTGYDGIVAAVVELSGAGEARA